MKGKSVFYCEWAYVIGLVVLAFGTALMEKADFGMSMVVAPAYLIHLKVSQYFPFFSFGIAEYVVQAVLLGLLSLAMGKIKKSYLLSFVTAFLYGTILDITIKLAGWIPDGGMAGRVICYAAGLVICSMGVALLMRTYLPPEAYELVVKEFSQKYKLTIGKTKTIYDCCSCGIGILLSLCFFGDFVGVKWGTIVCALINGWFIGRFSRYLEKNFLWKDALALRNKL